MNLKVKADLPIIVTDFKVQLIIEIKLFLQYAEDLRGPEIKTEQFYVPTLPLSSNSIREF